MTDEEKRLQEELLRKIEEVNNREKADQQWTFNDGQQSQGQQAEEAYWDAIQKQRRERVLAKRRWAERQQAIDEMPRQQYAVIVAIDQHGGFAKDGKMPWHYPTDLKWFKNHTQGQIVVMGRTTYEDINARLKKSITDETSTEETAPTVIEPVLPGRKCFVVSSTLESLPNATVIKHVGDVGAHLEDEDLDKTVFFIGGERIFREGIALANQVYVTVIDKNYACDKFFPTEYLQEFFVRSRMFKNKDAPELRFTIWQRTR